MTDLSLLDERAINCLRFLAVDAIQKANSGHPGMPLGAAPLAYVLWTRHLRHDPADPTWPDRDRFVLSSGHASMLLYGLLHLCGYDLGRDELQQFRQWQSRTPGHPEAHLTPGVEATTGPLGQGTANAVGMAIAERRLAHLFNRPGHTLVDHRTYALVSDGDLMEGIASEAASLAGHLKLGKLTWIYDSNDVTLDGPTAVTFSEDVAARHRAYGWQVLEVADGNHDLAGIDRALAAAKADTSRPTLIIVKTTIGYGSPKKHGTSAAHGSPLGPEEVRATKEALGWPTEPPFLVPDDVQARYAEAAAAGRAVHSEWRTRLEAWSAAHPELRATWDQALAHAPPDGWADGLGATLPAKPLATRESAGLVLNDLAGRLPWVLGGDADLGGSTQTQLRGEADFDGQSGAGRNLRFGVREHAMAAIANGIAYHGGLHPYVSTFLQFADYMRPAIRLAAMNHLPVTFVFTHDSVALGEDGPTHQPVEHLMALRLIPELTVLRPADAREAVAAWRTAIDCRRPVALALSRQKLPLLAETTSAAAGLPRGAYVLRDPRDQAPALALLATGSEVSLALAAAERLDAEGIPTRVISMPSLELFAAQPADYRDAVLPPALRARLAIELGVSLGWQRWVGEAGAVLAVDRYGASAPAEVILHQLGFTVERVVARARQLCAR